MLIVGNLYASNRERNPRFKGGARGAVVNNLIYNPGSWATHCNLLAAEWEGDPRQLGRMALVGNVLRHGPDTRRGAPLVGLRGEGHPELFARDNLILDRAGRPMDATATMLLQTGAEPRQRPEPPRWPEGLRPLPASDVAERVPREAGARPWDRDPIDSERQAGGYPKPAPTRQRFDPAGWELGTMTPVAERSR